jgi:hypothetical protein
MLLFSQDLASSRANIDSGDASDAGGQVGYNEEEEDGTFGLLDVGSIPESRMASKRWSEQSML